MPALPVIPLVWRLTLNWTAHSGVQPRNVIHVRDVDGVDNAAAIVAAVVDSMQPDQWAGCPISTNIHTITALHLNGIDPGVEVPTGDVPQTFGGTGGDTIPQAAGIVKFQSTQRGRSGRGRIYLGPIGESAQADGELTPTISDDHQVGWDAFKNALPVHDHPVALVVASYRHVIAHDVITVTARRRLGTQRRRLEQLPLV